MINKTLTYAQQMAEVNSTLCAAASVKAAPHKGGTIPMKTLLTRWGVKGSLYVGMTTHSIYKCIGLGEVRCTAGFARKEILADGYGTAKDCQWLVEDEGDSDDKKKKDLQKRQELGDMLMKHGKEMIHIKDMSAKEMGVMLQGIIATKKAATAAKSAATKAAKKAGNK